MNFGGGARTGETEAKASSLEQGVRGSFTEPYLFQPGLSLRLTGSTWWAQEPIYEYRSSGGRVVLSKDFSRVAVGTDRGARNRLSLSLIREYEDYAISESALADPTFRDELIALGLDPDTGRGTARLSAFEIDFERNTSAQPLNPRQGYSVVGTSGKCGIAARRQLYLQRSSWRGADLPRAGSRVSCGPTAPVPGRSPVPMAR